MYSLAVVKPGWGRRGQLLAIASPAKTSPLSVPESKTTAQTHAIDGLG